MDGAPGCGDRLRGRRGHRKFYDLQEGRRVAPAEWGGAGKVELLACLPPDLQHKLVGGDGLLRSVDAARAALQETGVGCALDPVLRRRGREYGSFLGELWRAGVIEACEEHEVREETGCFFVARKDGKLRVIFDTRRANCWFEAPDFTPLPSGESLSDLQTTRGQVVELRAADVEVCFYQYSMPAWARGYFCLPRVETAHLPADMRSAGGFVSGSVRFRVKVVPMGWAWAVFFIQAAHRHVQARTQVPSFWLQDKIPSPTVEAKVVARVLYIDNFATISVDADAGEAALEEMELALEAKGIIAHRDEPTAAGPPTLLGFQLGPARARWRIADKRF